MTIIRTNNKEDFEDYYPTIHNEDYNLFHFHNCIQFFVSMYNDKTFENYFINELKRGEYIFKLTEPIDVLE